MTTTSHVSGANAGDPARDVVGFAHVHRFEPVYQNLTDAVAYDRMIVDEQDSNHFVG